MPDPSIHARFLVLICALLQAPGLAQAFPAELFNPPLNYAANANLRGIVAADLDDDGDLDIVVTSEYQDAVSVFLNDAGSAFAILASYPVGSDPWAVIASDFNGDSRLDLAVANNGSTYSNAADTISLRFGNGDGTFLQAGEEPSTGSYPSDIVAGDFNGDGLPPEPPPPPLPVPALSSAVVILFALSSALWFSRRKNCEHRARGIDSGARRFL